MLAAVLAACGDAFEYEGTAGEPTAASFDLWVPVVEISTNSGNLAITGSVIVDTGAPFTILDGDVYGFGDGQRNEELRGFGLTFRDYPIIVYDVFDQAGGGYDGLLGGDLLRHFALSLDYRGERLWLRDTDTSSLPSGVDAAIVDASQAVTFELAGGGRAFVPGDCPGGCGTTDVAATRILVRVVLEDRPTPIWFLVDTGASATVLSESLVAELGDPSRPLLSGVSVGTVNGVLPAYFTRVSAMALVSDDSAVEIDVVAQTSQPVLVVPGWDLFAQLEDETGVPVRGLVGGSFLRHFLTTVDYLGAMLRLARYVDQSHVNGDEFVRVGFTLSPLSGQWQVVDVYDNTDAAAEGLRRGDVIVEIDGTDITGLDEVAVGNLFGGFGLGQQVPVGIQVGSGVQTVDVMVEDLLPAYE